MSSLPLPYGPRFVYDIYARPPREITMASVLSLHRRIQFSARNLLRPEEDETNLRPAGHIIQGSGEIWNVPAMENARHCQTYPLVRIVMSTLHTTLLVSPPLKESSWSP